MIRSTSANTELVAMFNRTLRGINAANRNMSVLTDIRPDQLNISYRNEALYRLMNHHPHQTEF